jgi:hypothetical protein
MKVEQSHRRGATTEGLPDRRQKVEKDGTKAMESVSKPEFEGEVAYFPSTCLRN